MGRRIHPAQQKADTGQPCSNCTQARNNWTGRLAQFAIVACLLLAGFFGLQSLGGSRHEPAAAPAQAPHTTDIEQVKIFDRLMGRNPVAEDTHRDLAEPDPETWRVLELSMLKSNGKPLEITLARPIAWLEATGAHTGGTIELNLPEMGAVGAAEVVAIRPCPPLRAGPGNVVTGTFAHEPDDNLLNIHLEGASDPIGCTPNHRFWSETAQSFVEAAHLHPGDTLHTRQHGPIRITAITSRPFEHRVYNLEVHGEHVYEVALSGVLVHNNYVYHGTDSASASSILNNGLNEAEWHKAAGGAGVDPKGFSVTTSREIAEAWATARAAERGGTPVVLRANAADLPLRPGSLTDLADPHELFVSPSDFGRVGPGAFGP